MYSIIYSIYFFIKRRQKKLIENGTKVDVQFTTTDKAEPLTSKISL